MKTEDRMNHLPDISAPKRTPFAAAVVAAVLALIWGGVLAVLT
ncbi:hypothetical protein N8315_04895 [Octadecabacter sp.]|nr:hypothetical protein [Octadecabacter sp.]MDC1380776.1 hypothetical protein [Octadecabacter sp.]